MSVRHKQNSDSILLYWPRADIPTSFFSLRRLTPRQRWLPKHWKCGPTRGRCAEVLRTTRESSVLQCFETAFCSSFAAGAEH